ncbi:unnamed protein product [Bursaphelenchus xylophilus]|uniref:(pine wood nematode) hypothetical protein n=1 Tax=Bursaphelenchus xylophilus TaxID=6326 RepID=A0A7I8WTX3_BURXY|nr:unnamed protein product [Bursaphelenchus xylophilus]CAG9116318.1 unnamed protein product [Bursaphelenchus xylophilus]
MDDVRWLEACRRRGHLNESHLSRWISVRNEQIRSSAFILSLVPALSLINLLLCIILLTLIVIALRNPSVKLRTYSFISNQLFVDVVASLISLIVGFTAEIKESFDSLLFLALFVVVFPLTSIGLIQILSSIHDYARNEFSAFYNKFRVEYVVLLNVGVWFISGAILILFSPIFFILDLDQNKNCDFFSCRSPLLAVFLLVTLCVCLGNVTMYFSVLKRLRKQENIQRETNDAPIAKQCLQSHKKSESTVILYTVTACFTIGVFVFLSKFLLEIYQLRKLHSDCKMGMRLALIDNIQISSTIILILWTLRTSVNTIFVLTADYLNLLWFMYRNDTVDSWTDDQDVIKKVRIKNVFPFSV